MGLKSDIRNPLREHFEREEKPEIYRMGLMSGPSPEDIHRTFIRGRDLIHDLNQPLRGADGMYGLLVESGRVGLAPEAREEFAKKLAEASRDVGGLVDQYGKSVPKRADLEAFNRLGRAVMDDIDSRNRCLSTGLASNIGRLNGLSVEYDRLPLRLEGLSGADADELAALKYLGARELRRASQMMGDYVDMAFRKKMSRIRKPFDVNGFLAHMRFELTKGAHSTIHSEGGQEGARLRLSMELGEVPKVAGDEFPLEGAFENLIRNARDSMSKRFGAEQPGSGWQPLLGVTSRYTDGRVEVRISDNGSGIRPEDMERIFESGYSTKGEGHQGAGLDIARRTFEEHGGTLTAESGGVDSGATFVVRLPPAKA